MKTLSPDEIARCQNFIREMGFAAMADEFAARPEYRERIMLVMRREAGKNPDKAKADRMVALIDMLRFGQAYAGQFTRASANARIGGTWGT